MFKIKAIYIALLVLLIVFLVFISFSVDLTGVVFCTRKSFSSAQINLRQHFDTLNISNSLSQSESYSGKLYIDYADKTQDVYDLNGLKDPIAFNKIKTKIGGSNVVGTTLYFERSFDSLPYVFYIWTSKNGDRLGVSTSISPTNLGISCYTPNYKIMSNLSRIFTDMSLSADQIKELSSSIKIIRDNSTVAF